jgi:glutamine amidotransferase
MPPIAIVDYKAGNLTSVKLAFDSLDAPAEIVSDPAVIRRADRIVFPGVGAAGAAMANLEGMGLRTAILEAVTRGVPFFGICVGTQILFDRSEEDGGTACLGVLPGEVRRFQPVSKLDKVPQMGWNSVVFGRSHPLLEGVADGSEFYFVHSYYPAPAAPECIVGRTEYAGVAFASVVARGNLFATQFHPEKSGRVGLRLLANFARWSPAAGAGRGAPPQEGPTC